jgi:hypothetical protein
MTGRQVATPDSPCAFKLASTIGTAILSAPSFVERFAKHSGAKRSIAGQIERFAHAPNRYREPSQKCTFQRQACTEKTQITSPEWGGDICGWLAYRFATTLALSRRVNDLSQIQTGRNQQRKQADDG